MVTHANKLSSDGTEDEHGDRQCVAPLSHLGTYYWNVAMTNNACMCLKDTVVIPAEVRSEGLVGGYTAAVRSRNTTKVGVGAAQTQA